MMVEDDLASALSSNLSENEIMTPTFIVTDLLTSLGEKNQDPDYLVTKGNDLVTLLKSNPYIKEDLVIGAFGHRLQTLLTHSKKEVVATGYRIARFIISNQDSIKALVALRLDVLMIISLSKSSTYDVEREQALKLLRKFLDTPNGYRELTRGLCASLLSITSQNDDNLRKISIETCCEICILRPDLISPSHLIQFIVEASPSNFDVVSLSTVVMLKLLNSPQGREYFQTSDVLKLISPITDFSQVDLHKVETLDSTQKRIQHETFENLNSTCYILTNILKGFNGLYLFSLGEFQPLKVLLKCLRYPVENIVSRILDLLLDILLIKPYEMKRTSSKAHLAPLTLENAPSAKLQYTGLLLSTLLSCGVTDELAHILNVGKGDTNSTKAGFLLIELHNLALDILPNQFYRHFENLSSDINTTIISNTDIVHLLESISRKSSAGRLNLGMQNYLHGKIKDCHIKKYSHIKSNDLNPLKSYGTIDELKLKQILMDTMVLSSKNFTKWDCEIIGALFNDPFLSGRRLEDINRTSKFIKRLLSFFRPFKNKFSATRKTKSSVRFIDLGCIIFRSLLKSFEGIKILQESKILPQIAECLAQLDPYSGFHAKDQIFSKARLTNTLTSGYFKMLGTLSEDQEGLKMIEKWKIFSMIHHIGDNRFKRDDVLLLFIDNVKFNPCENSVVILRKCLHSENLTLKFQSLVILTNLVSSKQNVESSTLELLVTQLYESVHDEDSRAIVISALNDYISKSNNNLIQVVRLGPNINILLMKFKFEKYLNMNEVGLRVLFRFLSTDEGYTYLNKTGFIDEHFQIWINGGKYLTYVEKMESTLFLHDSHLVPLNLFEELVKTEEGFDMVLKSGILAELVGTIKQYSILLNQAATSEIITFNTVKLKACIWSIGFISVVKKGYERIDNHGCFVDLIVICRKTPFLDIKATCFYVFSMISKSPDGYELLDEIGWQTKLNPYQEPCGVVLPVDINQFISPFDTHSTSTIIKDSVNFLPDIESDDKTLKKIIKLVGGLCSHLNFDKYSNELFLISKTCPEYFKAPDVFYLVLSFFENYNYRFSLRKFIIDLFLSDGKLLEILVKRDKRRNKATIGISKS